MAGCFGPRSIRGRRRRGAAGDGGDRKDVWEEAGLGDLELEEGVGDLGGASAVLARNGRKKQIGS